MPPRDARAFLADMLEACDAIIHGCATRDMTDYESDRFFRSSMERELMIIGEALNRALQLRPALEAEISNSRRIVDFRNVVVHAYHSLAPAVVWAIMADDVPRLRAELAGILARS